eukprot:6455945-Amphidinium_carterae.5
MDVVRSDVSKRFGSVQRKVRNVRSKAHCRVKKMFANVVAGGPDLDVEQPEATGRVVEQGDESQAASTPQQEEIEVEVMATSLGSSVPKGGDVSCSHCSHASALASMINYGCRTYPRFRCRACHSAVRALERSAKSRGQASFEAFSNFRKTKWSNYNDLVLAIRIAPENEEPLPNGEDKPKMGSMAGKGCLTLCERKNKLTEMIESMFAECGNEAFEEYAWLTERRYVCFMRNSEGFSASEAQASWDKALATKERRWKDNQWQVAVLTKEGQKKYQKKGTKRSYDHVGDFDDDGNDEDGSANKVRGIRQHLEAPSEMLADSMFSECVVPAAPQGKPAAGAQSVQALLGKLSGQAGVETSTTADIGENEFESLALTEEVLKKMGLTKAIYEEKKCMNNLRISPTSLGWGCRGLLCKRLGILSFNDFPAKARQHFSGHVRTFLQKAFEQKSSAWKALTALVEKLGPENEEVTATGCIGAMAEFKRLCETLQERKAGCRGWSKDNFVASHIDAFTVLISAASMHKRIIQDSTTLRSVRLLEVRQLSGERRKLALAIRRNAKALTQQSFFRSILAWFGDSVLGLSTGKLSAKSNLAKSAEGKYVDRHVVFTPAEQEEHADVMQPLLRLLADVSRDCNLQHVESKVLAQFETDGNNFINKATLSTQSFVVRPECVPKLLLDGHRPPSGVESFAKPFVLGGKHLGWRCGAEAWNLHIGVGMMLFGNKGSVAVLTVGMEAIHKCGGSALQLTDFLDGMSGADATEFMNTHARYYWLSEGSFAWIPWGFHISLVTTTERSVTTAFPWYSKPLRSKVSDTISKQLQAWHEGQLGADEKTPANLQALMWWNA